MEKPDIDDFSAEINLAFYEIAEAINLADNEAIFDACLELRQAIKEEEIGAIINKLIETAEDEAFDPDTILRVFMNAQQAHLNELKTPESDVMKSPDSLTMENIFEDMRAHSGDNDKQALVTLKLAEILKEPEKIDIKKMMEYLIIEGANTDFEDLINSCMLRAQDIVIKELATQPEAPLNLGHARFIMNNIIGEA